MDISVSRLNNRMVLQVPNELPLGLVFIVGRVADLALGKEGELASFELIDAGYRLQCQLSNNIVSEALLQDEQMVRAGGHLSFDAQKARYFLLARSIDVITEKAPTNRPSLSPILDDLRMRADTANIIRAELPSWVKQLAPPEVQAELGLIEEDWDEAETDLSVIASETPSGELSEEMVSYLSQAIDGDDDVELTPEMLASFIPLPRNTPQASEQAEEALRQEEASLRLPIPSPEVDVVEEGDEEEGGELEKGGEPMMETALPVLPSNRRLLILVVIILALIFLTLCALFITQVTGNIM